MLLPAGCVCVLDACRVLAGSETAPATPPGGGGGGAAVEWKEGVCGGLDAGAMAPPSTSIREKEH